MIEDDPRVRRWMFWTLVALSILLLFLLAYQHAFALQISCTESAFHTELARINNCTNYTGDCSLSGRTITFNCTNTTINLRDDDSTDRGCSAGTWFCVCDGWPSGNNACASGANCASGNCWYNNHTCHAGNGAPNPATEPSPGYCSGNWRTTRRINVPDVVIDGQTNNITFELDPHCNARVGTGATEFEQGAPFVEFRDGTDGGTVKNLTLRYFWQAIQMSGSDVDAITIDNVTIHHACDDYIRGFGGTGVGNVVKNSTMTDGTDKCISIQATRQQADNWIIDNNTVGCAQPLNVIRGRVRVTNNDFGLSPGKHSRIHNDSVAILTGNLFDNMQRGLLVYGSATATLIGNTFQSNSRGGLACCESARCDVECNSFITNGSSSTTGAAGCEAGHTGGASKSPNAILDLGGGSLSSTGLNTFRNNVSVDVASLGGTISATGNCWSDTAGLCDDATPDVSGSVTTTSPLSTPPTTCTPPITPPSTESNCSDGIDNDEDNLTDCADPDCNGVGSCEATETTCTDDFDNDGDGLIDCADGDCSAEPSCPTGADDLIIISDVSNVERGDTHVASSALSGGNPRVVR